VSIVAGRTGGDSVSSLGKVESFKFTVGDAATDMSLLAKYMPWISFSFYNDGPDAVYFSVNEDVADMDTPIYEGEDAGVDMGVRKISRMLLICDTGKTASLRLYSKS
jgi:hypothetical protein